MDLLLLGREYSRLWEGLTVTLQVLGWSVLLGTFMSLVGGIARLSKARWMRTVSLWYIEFARGISAIVLLFWMFFALPIILGLQGWSPLVAGVLALGLNMGAYGAEIVRGAIQAVPKGQTEATIALNMSNAQRIRYIVLPQAVPIILPPFGNLVIEILKGTALVSLITLSDVAFELQKLRVNRAVLENSSSTIVLYVNVLIIYFIVAQIISGGFHLAERRMARKFGAGR